MLFTLLVLAFTSVSAQDEQGSGILGVCVMYGLAFPSGHTEADLDTVFWNHMPSDLAEEFTRQEVPEVSTSDFVEVYESQREFCEEHDAEIKHFLVEAESEHQLTPEIEEFLQVMMFENTVVLSQMEVTTGRRQLPAAAAAIALLMVLGITAVMFGFVIGGILLVNWIEDQFRRRRRQLSAQIRQELTTAKGGARRALTAIGADMVEIPTMELIAACNNNVPSFVCELSTLALTQVITSQFCGGSNLDACNANLQYALGYLSALAHDL